MKFLGGSPLSENELAEIAREMVAIHGDAARDFVNELIDDANARHDVVEHASWMNVSLGIVQLLRPGPRWTALG